MKRFQLFIIVLMLLFAETHPDFYNAYKNARIIIDYAGGAPYVGSRFLDLGVMGANGRMVG